jgi:MraZ protein
VEVERAIRRLPSVTEPGRSLQRLYIGHAQESKMDGQGRILIPPELRDFASLDKKVVLVGQANKFELWDEAAWNKIREDSL